VGWAGWPSRQEEKSGWAIPIEREIWRHRKEKELAGIRFSIAWGTALRLE